MPAPRRPVPPTTRDALVALLARQGGLLQWSQALALGLTDSQVRTLVRRGELLRVRHGVLALVENAPGHVLECDARWKSVPAYAVLSHESAGVIHGFPDVTAPEHPSLLIPRSTRGAVAGARLGTLPPRHVQVVAGLPVTTPARTLIDLLRCAGNPLVAQVIADGAARKGVRSTDVDLVLADCAGWPGIVQARSAWEHADARAESVLESRHRALFRLLGLPVPELQVRICDRRRVIARVDFFFRAQRTVVESDGRVKYENEAVPDDDLIRPLWDEKLREDRLRDLGLEVVRATWADSVDGGADLHSRIMRAFARAERRRAA